MFSFCWVMLFVGIGGAKSQYFDPLVDDQVYLDEIQHKIAAEVNSTRTELYHQTKIIEIITKNFVAAQLKENLFIALRVLAEKELKELYMERSRPSSSGSNLIDGLGSKKDDRHAQLNEIKEKLGEFRRPRQDDDDDDGDSATTLRAADAAPFQMGLIPQVANLVKAIFGGNRNVNLTSYVSSATRLLPKPVGTQVVGLVSALSEPIKSTTLRPYFINAQPTSPPLVVFLPQQNNQEPLRQYNEQWLQKQQNILLNKQPPLLGVQQGMPIESGINSTNKNQQINSEYRPQSAQLDTKPNADGTKRRTVVSGQNSVVQPQPSRVVERKPGSIQEQFQQTQNRFPVQTLQAFPTQQQLGQKLEQVQPPAFPPQPQPPRRPEDYDEDDYDEDGRKRRQFSLASLLPSLLGSVFRTTRAPLVYQTVAPVAVAAAAPVLAAGSTGVQTQAVGTPMVQPGAVPAAIMPQGFNLRMFAEDFGKNFNDIIRVMPDIFRGAREGVQLLQTISTVLGGFEGIAGILPI